MKIVSLATHMPYVGIPHAGGEYYERHADLLARSHDVTVICPYTAANAAAMSEPVHGSYKRVLVVPQAAGGALRHGARSSRFSRALPFLTMGSFLRAVLADAKLTELLETADRIELQWFDAVALAPRLRRLLPDKPLVGVFHDVASQGYRRALLASALPLTRRALALVRLVLVVPLERRALDALQTALVFSDKDAALLARLRGTAQLMVVPFPLDDEGMPGSPRVVPPPSPSILFVGAMWRPENEDAALWLVRDIWPRVKHSVPSARLTIAGATPTERLRAQATSPDIELTGRVETLAPYYRRASVAVVPLRLGAGVKFKCIVAMLWGVPVVATRVAAEGIEGSDVFAAVVDDAPALAAAVIETLTHPSAALEAAARAHAWSHRRYTSTSYQSSLEALYP